MARSYKRDKNGRFSGGGGGGGGGAKAAGGSGGKMGKSAKNETARAKYKQASTKARIAEKEFGGNSPAANTAFGKRAVAGAKSGLTRVTQNLRGGAKGNLGSAPVKSTPPKAKSSGATPAKSTAAKSSSSMTNQVAAGRAAKAAYQSKSASKRKAAVSRKGGSFTETSTFKNSLKPKQAKARQAKKAAKR